MNNYNESRLRNENLRLTLENRRLQRSERFYNRVIFIFIFTIAVLSYSFLMYVGQ